MSLKHLDKLIEGITIDAYGDDEQLWAFRQAFEDDIDFPTEGFVIGEPVRLLSVDYEGNERRGLTVRCRSEKSDEYEVALPDVVFPQGTTAADYVAAYRKWLGLDPFPAGRQTTTQSKRRPKARADDLDLSRPIELVVLVVKDRAVSCRLLKEDMAITLRAKDHWDLAPGEIVTVKPHKHWRYGGHPYLSGEIESSRLDIEAIGLIPLGLKNMGAWSSREHDPGDENDPTEAWAGPIDADKSRPVFEMEQIVPGTDPDDPFDDPFLLANELKDVGEQSQAKTILMELCRDDLRCLDAHAHLGNIIFDHQPQDAIRHYEAGMRIGELSLGEDFTGLLPWGHVNNRPFLRCLQGYGLCLWRLGRFEEAERVFNRMLRLNPPDNQGIRFLIPEIQTKRPWTDHKDEEESNAEVQEEQMDVKMLAEMPPWDWPKDVDKTFLAILADERADAEDRLMAAELAGSISVINDVLISALFSVLQNKDEPEKMRGTAAIALGPVLEYADTGGFDDMDDNIVSEAILNNIQERLHRLYLDGAMPKTVRRRILETSVRGAPLDWHQDAVRAAWSDDDEDWRLTAVFAMRWVRGFDKQILKALKSDNPGIRCEAVRAAGNWELDGAWPYISELITAETTDKELLLTAIEASVNIRPLEAVSLLSGLIDSEDQDISDTAYEAMAMIDGLSEDDFFDDYDEDEDEDEDDVWEH